MTVLDQISAQVKDQLGIHLGPHKDYLLAARLERMVSQEGIENLEAFLADLSVGDLRAVDVLARHMTTNHTYFFREQEHFRLVCELLVRNRVTQPKIWSAAGSSGEEAYSLAMVLAEAGILDFQILVSDVNRDVLRRASQGVYDETRMERVPGPLVDRYFSRHHEGGFRVKDGLRNRLRFRHVNLSREWDLAEPLDAIFCRNVFIYFASEGIPEVLDRLVASLKPGGWLFLGQTEGFHLPPGTRRIGPAAYQKVRG